MIELLSAAAGRDVSRETFEKISAYVTMLTAAAAEQNLVAPSTLGSVWERHILDSAQLVAAEPRVGASWVDIGSGAGLPGLIIALLVEGEVSLIEPRRLRADFLRAAVEALGLQSRVTVECAKVERVAGSFDVITARAVAPLERFLAIAGHLAKSGTVWVLPKGRNAQSELAQARRSWHCDARIVQSRTDPDSEILVLTRVGAKKKR
jgi:16S rRNA (guanine527-N7)-methyltransferase